MIEDIIRIPERVEDQTVGDGRNGDGCAMSMKQNDVKRCRAIKGRGSYSHHSHDQPDSFEDRTVVLGTHFVECEQTASPGIGGNLQKQYQGESY